MHIYAYSGVWRSSKTKGWKFLVDEETGGRLLTLDTSKTFDNLRVMVSEDFGTDLNLVNIELSYLPSDLVIGLDSPPVFITNDRQLQNFLTYVKTKASTRLCVCIRSKVGFNLNEEPAELPNREEVGMSGEVSDDIDGEAELEAEDAKIDESDDESKCEKDMINGKYVRFSLVDVLKKGQHFTSKAALQATMEICAMKHNFDYKVAKTDRRVWYVRCAYDDCRWRVRAEGLTCSSYFIIKSMYLFIHVLHHQGTTQFGRLHQKQLVVSLCISTKMSRKGRNLMISSSLCGMIMELRYPTLLLGRHVSMQ